MKKLLIALLCLAPVASQAQLSTLVSGARTYVNANITTNGVGAITGAKANAAFLGVLNGLAYIDTSARFGSGANLATLQRMIDSCAALREAIADVEVSGGGSGTVTSVALTLPSGFSVTGSPVTTSGTLAISAPGNATTQYINGAGGASLVSNLPVSTAGAAADAVVQAFAIQRANHTGTQALSTISQSGATSGQQPQWNGSAWVPVTPSGGTSYTAGSGISISGGNVISATGGIADWNGVLDSVENIPDVPNAVATHAWVDSYYVAISPTLEEILDRLDVLEAFRDSVLGDTSGSGGGGGGSAAGTYAGVSGVFLDLDADSAMTFSSGSTVSVWDNLAGADAATTQGSPTLVAASGITNPNFVDFGSTDEMGITGLAIPTTSEITVYAVIKQPTASGGTMFILGPSGSGNTTGFGIQSQYPSSNTLYSYYFGNTGASDAYSAINPLRWQLVKITLNKNLTTGEVRVDMNGGSTSIQGANNTNNTNAFGAALNASLGGEYLAGGQNWTGGIAKLVMFDHATTGPEDTAVKAALSTRYTSYAGTPTPDF